MSELLNSNFEITQEQKDLVFGTSLGDAFLFTKTGKAGRYEAAHSAKQQDYLFHIYEILKIFSGSALYTCKGTNKNVHFYYRFATKTHDFFHFYVNIFYTLNPENNRYIKDVPSLDVLNEHLIPRAIAYWFMDDGAFYWGCLICTDSFSMEGLIRLKTVFLEKFNIVVSFKKIIVKDVIKSHRLYINPENCEKFVPLIKPYMLPSIFYKLPKKYR